MIRFDGHSILIADADVKFAAELSCLFSKHGGNCFHVNSLIASKDLLNKFDFDIVISNYYLTDGIIHQLMDWSLLNLEDQPIFTCIGHPFPSDAQLCRKQAIAGNFSKSNQDAILSSVSNLLFDINDFHKSLSELLMPEEIRLDFCVGEMTYSVYPIEADVEKIHIGFNCNIPQSAFGVLRFSLTYENQSHEFMIPGLLKYKTSEDMDFVIHKDYTENWSHFLRYLNLKQLSITQFLSKAAGF